MGDIIYKDKGEQNSRGDKYYTVQKNTMMQPKESKEKRQKMVKKFNIKQEKGPNGEKYMKSWIKPWTIWLVILLRFNIFCLDY